MRASATSRIASHAALTGAQATNNTPKADDPASFAMMLAGAAAPKTKGGDKQADNQDKQPSQEVTTSDAAAAPQTVQAQTASQATAQAKPAKDSKTDDSDDQTVAQSTASDASADPSAAMTVALQAPPQQPLPQTSPIANDNDGDNAVDGVAAAGKAAAAAAASQGNGKTDDTDTNGDATATDTGQQPQQAAAQALAQTPAVQPKGIAKPGQPVEKSTARKAIDAGDGIKAADKAADAKADIKADAVAAAAPQAPTTDTKTADNLTLTGITAPQGTTGATSQALAAPPSAPATHIEVTAQPNVPALAVEIAAKSQSGAKQFDIRLDPPELGRVEVRLSIDSTGKASAHLSADQPQTLDLLQKDAPALTRALRDAGLDVSQDGLNFSLRQQNQDAGTSSGFSGGGGARGRATLSAIAGNDTTSSSNATSAYRAPLNGRLDIKV